MRTESVSGTELIENDEDSHLEQVFVRSKTVVSRCVAGETLIVPVRGKVGDLASIYSFNGTKTVAQLVGAVEQEYAVEHKRAEQDVHRFLDDMLSVDLVAARRAEQFAGESHVE
jgi:hypothetical protein